MKFYDRELAKTEERIKSIVWVLFLFIIGFVVGYYTGSMELQKMQRKIDEQYVEIDSLKETIHMYEVYGK